MHASLASLISNITNDEKEDIDLKDRAAFYCRIMQTNVNDLKKILEV